MDLLPRTSQLPPPTLQGKSANAALRVVANDPPGRLIGQAYPYVAMKRAPDNELDPADQDSRTSFPDKGPSERSRSGFAVG